VVALPSVQDNVVVDLSIYPPNDIQPTVKDIGQIADLKFMYESILLSAQTKSEFFRI
jgi:hypothetical protein